MPKRKIEDISTDGTTTEKQNEVDHKNSSDSDTTKPQSTSERKCVRPRRQYSLHHQPSNNSDSNNCNATSVSSCENNCSDHSMSDKCSTEMDHTYNETAEGDVNNHNNAAINSTVDLNDEGNSSGSKSNCSTENTKICPIPNKQVSELVNILSSDSEIRSKSKSSTSKVPKSILKVRTSPFSSTGSNSFNKGCDSINLPSPKLNTSSSDIVKKTEVTNDCKLTELRSDQTERDSLESNVESLSDKEIENDSVFESSNDTIDASPSDASGNGQKCMTSQEPLCSKETVTPVKWSSERKGRRPDQNCDETPDLEPPRKRKKTVHFEQVKVYYFPRKQGFTCVPSQGGSTLGMADNHIERDEFSIEQHAKLQRKLHKHILLEQHKQGKIHIPPAKLQQLQHSHQRDEESLMMSATSSQSSSQDEDGGCGSGESLTDRETEAQFSSEESDSEDDLQVDEYYFLQPIPTRQRRIMLRQSGVKKIDTVEKDMCKDIRQSREVCGCDCKGYCDPATCICSLAGIKCQVDRPSFPCGCTKDGCRNPEGRVEFNPIRVRTHFIHTLMRLENERKMDQRRRAIAVAKRRKHLKFLEENGLTEVGPKSEEDENVNNSDDNEDEDVSVYNSNELGSCRDCQTSDVSNFLIRQQQKQQNQLQQQQQQQEMAAHQQAAYSSSAGSSVVTNDPPSCMESSGVQQAYMTALDETTQMSMGGTEVGSMESDGQLYVNGEEYIAENTTDVFGCFAQEESSYSESSEDCSSVGSNPDAEVVVSAGGSNSCYNNTSGGYIQSTQQASSKLGSQQYDPSTVAVNQSSKSSDQGNNMNKNQIPTQSVDGGVGGAGIQQVGQPSYIPANNNYHQLQPSTVEAEQKYMDMNGTAAASFKLEPISEILNPIRFPGYPSGSGVQSWSGGASYGSGSGSGLSGVMQSSAPQLHEASNTAGMLMNSSSGDTSVCTVVQQYNNTTAGPNVGVLNAKSFTANNTTIQQSVQDCSDTMYVTQQQRQCHHGEDSVKTNHENLSTANIDSISVGENNIVINNKYPYPTDNIAYTSNSVVFSNMGLVQQPGNCQTDSTSALKSNLVTSSSVVEGAKKQSIKRQQQPRAAKNTVVEAKSYHELKTSSCHSASEAVYSSNLTLLQNDGDSSVNLSLSHESHHLQAVNAASCSPAKLSSGSCPLEPDSTSSSLSNSNKCTSAYNVSANSCIQGLGELVDSVSSAVTTTNLNEMCTSYQNNGMIGTFCSQNSSATIKQHQTDLNNVSSSSTSTTAATLQQQNSIAEDNVEETKSDGTATDDSEDSGLGSMTDDQTTTQNFGEIIKKSIVETVSA